ncbi:hypothetical protein MSAN_01993400 [Mycena sanguinolenta]|uniref:Uncharacterized protein n=1 Tax=Mycena sanguinolenta TaxID=230812 RepID=A0A8H6XLE6_9AGAR|nr:hypothetical protein MSAN_01993400 [Mycena sanguinolenta]
MPSGLQVDYPSRARNAPHAPLGARSPPPLTAAHFTRAAERPVLAIPLSQLDTTAIVCTTAPARLSPLSPSAAAASRRMRRSLRLCAPHRGPAPARGWLRFVWSSYPRPYPCTTSSSSTPFSIRDAVTSSAFLRWQRIPLGCARGFHTIPFRLSRRRSRCGGDDPPPISAAYTTLTTTNKEPRLVVATSFDDLGLSILDFDDLALELVSILVFGSVFDFDVNELFSASTSTSSLGTLSCSDLVFPHCALASSRLI